MTAAGPWIPVSERLPEEGEVVLGIRRNRFGHYLFAAVFLGRGKWLATLGGEWTPEAWAALRAPEAKP